MKRNIKQYSNFAFTLVELLVVIAIIALLISILMPALAKAKEAAKKTVCAANVKDIGVAWQLYFVDYDGYLYKEFQGGGASSVRQAWFDYGGRESSINGGINTIVFRDRPLNVYMGYATKALKTENSEVFKCPSDKGGILLQSGNQVIPLPLTLGKSCYDVYGNSYFGNIFMFDSGVPESLKSANYATWLAKKMQNRLKVDTLHGPSEVLFIGEAPWIWQWAPNMPEQPSWHLKTGYQNMLYLDGHVAFIEIKKFDLPTLSEIPDPSKRFIPYIK